MKVDPAPCWHCRTMFEPWTNERYCSTPATTSPTTQSKENP